MPKEKNRLLSATSAPLICIWSGVLIAAGQKLVQLRAKILLRTLESHYATLRERPNAYEVIFRLCHFTKRAIRERAACVVVSVVHKSGDKSTPADLPLARRFSCLFTRTLFVSCEGSYTVPHWEVFYAAIQMRAASKNHLLNA